ncbi:Blp family class II bacteriocin [Paraclostridium bifermentans]|uniref:Blp family class II bacteriocin n=1 Tax=Paraclostridium bifermentans TaxID=1490 RepID=UPI00387B7C6F
MKNTKLQLPNNFIEINNDEMEYIDGGRPRPHVIERSISKKVVSAPVNALGWYFTGGAIGKGMAKLGSAASKAIGGTLSAGGLASIASSYTGNWWNFGDHLANYLDKRDRHPGNGRLDYLETVYY